MNENIFGDTFKVMDYDIPHGGKIAYGTGSLVFVWLIFFSCLLRN